MCCTFGKIHIICQWHESTMSMNLHCDCKEVSMYLISASEDNFLPMEEQVQISNFSAV